MIDSWLSLPVGKRWKAAARAVDEALNAVHDYRRSVDGAAHPSGTPERSAMDRHVHRRKRRLWLAVVEARRHFEAIDVAMDRLLAQRDLTQDCGAIASRLRPLPPTQYELVFFPPRAPRLP